MKLTLELGNGEFLTVYKENGRTKICCDKFAPIVVLIDAGLPGICGPTMEHDLEEINEMACKEARKYSVFDGE